MASIGKAYKNLVNKWNPDKYKNDSKNSKHEGQWNGAAMLTPEKKDNYFDRKHSVDDSLFTRSPSLLARTTTSRRSHTPTPRLHRNTSRSSRVMDSLKRSISRRATTSSSPLEARNNNNNIIIDDDASNNSWRSKSRRSTTPSPNYANESTSKSRRSTTPTPIVFSQSMAPRKPHHVQKLLQCSLEELCFGATKKITITKNVISNAGVIVEEEETLQINVAPGWRKGTTITFEGKGDEKPGYLPADIVFLIEEKKHPLFKRVGDDLELVIEVPLLKALVGCSITFPLLGGEKMVLGIDDVIFPGYQKIIQEQGMPKFKEKGHRGVLRLNFNVDFPLSLSDDKRSKICNILKGCF